MAAAEQRLDKLFDMPTVLTYPAKAASDSWLLNEPRSAPHRC
ncbi:hypothetical protein ACFCWG_05770 [Streptomyces sp. NPDC056390]